MAAKWVGALQWNALRMPEAISCHTYWPLCDLATLPDGFWTSLVIYINVYFRTDWKSISINCSYLRMSQKSNGLKGRDSSLPMWGLELMSFLEDLTWRRLSLKTLTSWSVIVPCQLMDWLKHQKMAVLKKMMTRRNSSRKKSKLKIFTFFWSFKAVSSLSSLLSLSSLTSSMLLLLMLLLT